MKLVKATAAPIANVIAASWNAGIFTVATVNTDSSDHIRIAVRPTRVAAREVIDFGICAERRRVRHGRARPGHPRLSCCRFLKTWMPGTRPGMTTVRNVRAAIRQE